MVADIVFVLAALAAVYVPVGNYMARVSTPTPMIQVLNGPSTASPALIRGFIATKKDGRIGNFRVDLTRTVFRNLLINARTYAPDSKVLLTGGAVQDCVEIRVIDHGPGIPEEKIDDIFVPFQRLNDTGASGLGLGLPVARGFVEEMAVGWNTNQHPPEVLRLC
ncbi:ATP-binding protein [Corynebacterium argentoratense]